MSRDKYELFMQRCLWEAKKILEKNKIFYKLGKQFIRTPFYKVPYSLRVRNRIKELTLSLPFVEIESTNACNAKCIMCPHTKMKRKVGIMEWELFEKIAKECASLKVKKIVLNGFGEPLLDPLLIERITYLKKLEVPEVQIYSNGSLLDGHYAYRLIDAGLDFIGICIDGVRAETFEKIRVGLEFNTLERKVKRFIEIREERKAGKPVVFIGFIRLRENANEREAFLQRWKDIADVVGTFLPFNWRGHVAIESFSDLIESIHSMQDVISPCTQLWKGINIRHNGDVVPCCMDYDGEFIIGNMKQDCVSDIWWGEDLKHLREYHLKGKRKELALCHNCDAPTCLSPIAWWYGIV